MEHLDKIVEIANSWVGREFEPGVPEQCMAFVRSVLADADQPLADMITAEPVDGLWTARNMANSLAGRDLGNIYTSTINLVPGYIVFFQDTYEGPWPPTAITHVAIYTGENQFVHRPTAAKPVEKASLDAYWSSHFRCALEPPEPSTTPVKIKIFRNQRGYKLVIPNDLPAGEYLISNSTQEFVLET
jgi:hypothetical protein